MFTCLGVIDSSEQFKMLTTGKKKKPCMEMTALYETLVVMPAQFMDNAVDVNGKNKQGSEDEIKRKRMLGKNATSIELLCLYIGHMVRT